MIIKAGKYTASIHCSYYAVFQYAKYILNVCTYKPIPYDKQSLDHTQIISDLESRIEVVGGDKKRSAGIRSSIHCLKSDRKKADYKVGIFNKKESEDILNKSKEIINELKTIFGLS